MTVTTLLVLIIPSFFVCFFHSFFVVGLVGCLCNLLSGTTLVEDPNGVIIFKQTFVHSPTKKFGKIRKKVFFSSV